jgi:GT2 family glycosyltransferase
MTAPLVSVLIVNWRSGELAHGLVRDLRRQRLPGHAPGEGLEFVVVDNASGPAEEPHLQALEGEGATVVRSASNSGYAVGVNVAAEQARGEFVFVANPDTMVFRGALAAMLGHLRAHERCGLVGPRGWLDEHRFFQLPPTELPTLCDLASETVARAWAWWGGRHAAARTRRAIRQWTATGPLRVTQVPGYGFMMRTALARSLGPFDPAYPFYFEDADLCWRLERAGFTCEVLPRAEMVHFFNRSAGQDQPAAMSRYWVSRRLFFRRRYGPLGEALARVLMAVTEGRSGKGHLFAPIDELGECAASPAIDVPGSGAYVAEIAVDPGFVFAAGRLDVSRRFRIPDAVWEGLVEAPYFVRFLERRSLRVLRTVSFRKTGAGRPVVADKASAALVHA